MIDYSSEFQRVEQHLVQELSSLRTNRANPSMIEGLTVMAYGSPMKLLELAGITAPEPQLLVVQPWDKSLLQPIEKAIASDDRLKMSPVVDGEIIRIPLPSLTEDRRRELVKTMNEIAEESRISVRRVREDALKLLKQQEKDGEISEDDYFRKEKEVQSAVDAMNEKIKMHAVAKEKELMTV